MTLGEYRRLLGLGWRSPWRVRRHIRRVLVSPWIRARLNLMGVEVSRDVLLFGTPIIRRFSGSTIRIGARVWLRSWTSSNVLGIAHPVMLSTLAAGAMIELGPGSELSGVTICSVTRVEIGEGALIGSDVLITDTDHHELAGPRVRFSLEGVRSAPISIGREAFVGARAIILKGTKVGDGAVVGAGSVVSGIVEPGAIVAGNPARQIGWVSGPSRGGFGRNRLTI
jgi:carbonic anhydrase/acetyltransferase-like protein (isoleucine patch superfamily)